MIKSIDISSYDEVMDFQKVKEKGISLVWIKASEGVSYVNPLMDKQYKGAKAVGLKVGFYHYMQDSQGDEQAKFFHNTVKGYEVDVPYCCDSEERTVNYALEKTKEFIDYIQSQGLKVILYCDEYYYTHELFSTKIVPLWVANYEGTTNVEHIGFQYTNQGVIEGCSEKLDLSDFDDSILLNQVKETIKQEIFYPNNSHDVNLYFGGNEMKNFKNGSTTENVYSDYNCTSQIGSLDTWESCQCVWCDGTRAIVKYKIDGTGNYKTGFVKYVGGVQ
jgi:GH25 family lysozyme M1 (1,4-beta-N-acetylmuramidase)